MRLWRTHTHPPLAGIARNPPGGRRQYLGRLLAVMFVAVIVFFGIRGMMSFWTSGSTTLCPSNSGWMSNPTFLCMNSRPTPIPLYEFMNPYRLLRIDCTLVKPTDMTLIYNLCCASTRVTFERVANSELVFENGTAVRLGPGDTTTIMNQAKTLVCTFNNCTDHCT